MIKYCYKDINVMADVYERHDGTRYAIYWGKYEELFRLGKFPEALLNSPGGMKVFAEKYEKLILQYGEKI